MNIKFSDWQHWAHMKIKQKDVCDIDLELCAPSFIKKDCVDCFYSENALQIEKIRHKQRLDNEIDINKGEGE